MFDRGGVHSMGECGNKTFPDAPPSRRVCTCGLSGLLDAPRLSSFGADPVQEASDRLDFVRDRVAAFQRRYDKERSHSNLCALQDAVTAQFMAENELRKRVKAYG